MFSFAFLLSNLLCSPLSKKKKDELIKELPTSKNKGDPELRVLKTVKVALIIILLHSPFPFPSSSLSSPSALLASSDPRSAPAPPQDEYLKKKALLKSRLEGLFAEAVSLETKPSHNKAILKVAKYVRGGRRGEDGEVLSGRHEASVSVTELLEALDGMRLLLPKFTGLANALEEAFVLPVLRNPGAQVSLVEGAAFVEIVCSAPPATSAQGTSGLPKFKLPPQTHTHRAHPNVEEGEKRGERGERGESRRKCSLGHYSTSLSAFVLSPPLRGGVREARNAV
jgi:hypothetical protein